MGGRPARVYYRYTMKLTVTLAAALLFSLSFVRASGFELEGTGVDYFKAKAPVVTVPAEPALKEWTVLFYGEGKSSAEGISLDAVNMIEEGGGSTDSVDYAAELTRGRGHFYDDPSDGDWTGARRYRLLKDDHFALIRSPALQTFEKVDNGDWRHLADFIKWGRTTFPAKRYALVILGHGSAWRDMSLTKGLALDEETGHGIENAELARAIAESGGKVDLLVLNACLMQTAEVLYDLKDSASYIVGSENVMRGIPYENIVPVLNAAPGMGASELAKLFVEKHGRAYGKYAHQNPTLSAVDASRLPQFFSLLDGWSRHAIKAGSKKVIGRQLDAAYGFDNSRKDSKDLADLVRLVGRVAKDEALEAKSRELAAFIDKELVMKNFGVDPRVTGVAAYVPARYDKVYDAQALARDTAWDDFLRAFR